MTRLLVVQPYIPAYRVALFRRLREELAERGIELVLAAGLPQGHMNSRGDDRTQGEADEIIAVRHLVLGGKSIARRRISPVLRCSRPNLVIVEQAVKNLEVYPLLMRQVITGAPRVAMWGQGRTFSTAQGTASRGLKEWLTRRSDWFFAYTQEGADYVSDHGFPTSRVTVLNNTIDTASLRKDLDEVSDQAVEAFRRDHQLVPGETGLFLGGVDPAKGIDFLLASARWVREQIPGFRLLIAGTGKSAEAVKARQSAGDPIVFLDRLDGEAKALALKASDLLMIPQWIGLVAIDSLVAGRPIITTHHSSHSPEFSYLRDGTTAFVFEHDLDAYASGVVSVLGNPQLLTRAQLAAELDSRQYSIDEMARRFAEGVDRWRGGQQSPVRGL